MANQAEERRPGPWPMLLCAGSFAGWTDGDLLRRFVGGRDEVGEHAFAVLVERHGAAVLRVCRGVLGDVHEAEDAFQATFVVLARRARSIREAEAVGPWLLGVAYRVAGCARTAGRRRRAHERRAAAMIEPFDVRREPGDHGPLLRDELGRLPEKFRSPLVLCYLDGLTQEEVARRLGWPIGTVRSRLARGRDRLRRRLILRGVVPAAAGLLVESWREAGAAPLPRALVGRTVEAVVGFGPGSVATPIATLSGEVMGTMNGKMIRGLAAAGLTAGLLVLGAGRAGALQGQGPGGGAAEKAVPPKAKTVAQPAETLPLYVVSLDLKKAADLGVSLEQVRSVIAGEIDPSDPFGHRSAWIDPGGKGKCFVRTKASDGGRLAVDQLLDAKVTIGGRRPTGFCPVRNLVTLTWQVRPRLDCEVEAGQAELRAAQADVDRAQARLRKAEAAWEEVRGRLESAVKRGL